MKIVKVKAETYELLEKLSKEENVSMADVLAKVIKSYIER